MHWGPALVPAFWEKDSGPALGDTCSVSVRHPGQFPCRVQEVQEPNQLIQTQPSAPDWFWSLPVPTSLGFLGMEVEPQPEGPLSQGRQVKPGGHQRPLVACHPSSDSQTPTHSAYRVAVATAG